MIQKVHRLRELDFLRGIAIVLVLFRHQYLSDFTTKMGWIGVDLFFVISGFLVSGLLFKEYIKFGNIKPSLFLIRRGFKIYPIYYLIFVLYLIPKIIKNQFEIKGFLADIFFVQNYIHGWGWAYIPSWSLAVEEHFYFSLVFFLFFMIKKNILFKSFIFFNKKINYFQAILLFVMLISLIFRFYNNIYHPEYREKNLTMTHLRIDSLLVGVLIAYLYYFRVKLLNFYYNLIKKWIFIIIIPLLSFTPFIDYNYSFFVRTIGFTMIYMAFGLLLIYFLLEGEINKKINFLLSEKIVNIIAKIGFSSYSIYLIHGLIGIIISVIFNYIFKIQVHFILLFLLNAVSSVITGVFITNYIEKYFLKVRDKYYPNRII
jgi:peptidoglycan/LPS O-acetylase OafA/YrhL